MKSFIMILIPLIALNYSAFASELSDLASQMQPGEWAELDTGLTSEFLRTYPTDGSGRGPDSVLQFADSAVWDPTSRQFLFIGAPHYRPYKFIIYNESSNSWRLGPLPPSGGLTHGYDHNAIDPATGNIYYRASFNAKFYKFNISQNSWGSLPDIPGNIGCCGGLKFFPEINGLIFAGGDFGLVHFFDVSTNQWTNLAEGLWTSSYSQFAEYNPVHKVVIFGGGQNGQNAFYKIDASKNITHLKSTPTAINVGSSLITVDPVSGKYLLFGRDNVFYEYDVTTDSWDVINSTPPIVTWGYSGNELFDTIAAPISTHGVIMFVKTRFDTSRVYLYKHAEGTGTPVPPPPPPEEDPVPAPSAPTNLQIK